MRARLGLDKSTKQRLIEGNTYKKGGFTTRTAKKKMCDTPTA